MVWNDHDWRFYDVAIGRFVTVDRLPEEEDQEELAPYHFSYNNPVLYSDPDGQCPTCFFGAIAGAITEYGTPVATNYVQGNPSTWSTNINLTAITIKDSILFESRPNFYFLKLKHKFSPFWRNYTGGGIFF